MSKKYGYFYEEELDKWEHLPAISLVLTSSYMGAWLQRRDERKANRERLEELEKIRRDILTEMNNSLKESTDYTIGLAKSIEFIDKNISELEGKNK